MHRVTPRLMLASLLGALALGTAFHFGTPMLQAQVGNPNNLILEGAPLGSAPQMRAFGLDANIGITLTPKGAGVITFNGPVTQASPVTTNVTFLSALEHCRADSALIVPLRVAANDWALARTAAGAETYNFHCEIPLPWQTTASKGAQLNSFTIGQQILIVDLTSNTFNDLSTVTYANNAANVIADYGGVVTITPPTVVQANPYLTSGTLGTPAFMNLGATAVNLDFTVVMANTGQYRLYGIGLAYSTTSF